MKLDKSLEKNVEQLNRLLPIKSSFDIVGREIEVADKNGFLLFVDGFAKDDIMIHVIRELQKTPPENTAAAQLLLKKCIPYIETGTETDFDMLVQQVLSGQIALLVDGIDRAIMVDAREYPARDPSESHIEKVTRGPRDDLVETLIFNTALIRRRIREPSLSFEICTVGSMSKTDVAVGYIGSCADMELVGKIKKRLNSIKVHALTMGEKSLEELLCKKKWYNPLPQFRISERPDTIAAHLMEGYIVVLVDGSPTAMILPSTLFEFTQYVEDYYQTPAVGTLTRIIRFIAIFAALLIAPLYLLMTWYPDVLTHMQPDKNAEVSVFIQILLLELGLELLRLSSLHTPQNIESAFSVIGGLILGDFAVSMGLFVADSIFFTVAGAIANHCIPNPELSGAIKLFRWQSILLTGFFGLWGFIVSMVIVLVVIATTRGFDEKHPYLWPLIPFDFNALKHLMLRYPLSRAKRD